MRRARSTMSIDRVIGLTLCLVVLLAAIGPVDALGGPRQSDRFGLRGGIWPQPKIDGGFGKSRLEPEGTVVYDARIIEDAAVVPYVEAFALLHIRGPWWFEGSIGWGARFDVAVGGFPVAGDTILLGEGRVDFFPIFGGIRLVDHLGEPRRPHNIYGRLGPMATPANESPGLTDPRLVENGVYSPGTEIAIGFLVGGGGEYYLSPTFALNADVSYRYTNFTYARNAKFNLSSIWAGVGMTLRTR